MNFESRISDLNHLGHEQNMLNQSTSTNLYDTSLSKFPLSPILNSTSYDNRDDQVRNNLDLWKMDMERKVRKFNLYFLLFKTN